MDSASTPEQLGRLLDDVKEAGAKRVLLVFGCPGTTSKEQRAAMMRVGLSLRFEGDRGGLVCVAMYGAAPAGSLAPAWSAQRGQRPKPDPCNHPRNYDESALPPAPSTQLCPTPPNSAQLRPTPPNSAQLHPTLPNSNSLMQVAHFKADAVYVTNDSPGVDWPNDIITDMVGGWVDREKDR